MSDQPILRGAPVILTAEIALRVALDQSSNSLGILVLLGPSTVRSARITVSDALDEYEKAFEARKGSIPADLRSRIDEIIKPTLGHHEVAKLTKDLVSDWHNARATSPAKLRTRKGSEKQNERPAGDKEALRKRRSTANRDLTVLKAALNLASQSRDWLPVAAWSKVKAFEGVDVAKRRYLNDDEARRLVNASDPEFRPMVRAALLTGGRYGELRHVRVYVRY